MIKLIVYLKERIKVVLPIGLCILMILHYFVSYGIMAPIKAYRSYLQDEDYALKVKTTIVDDKDIGFRLYSDKGALGYENKIKGEFKPSLDSENKNQTYYAYGFNGETLYLCLVTDNHNKIYETGWIAHDVPPKSLSLTDEELKLITIGNKLSFWDYSKYLWSMSIHDGEQGMYSTPKDSYHMMMPFLSFSGICWNLILIFMIKRINPRTWGKTVVLLISLSVINVICHILAYTGLYMVFFSHFYARLPMEIYSNSL